MGEKVLDSKSEQKNHTPKVEPKCTTNLYGYIGKWFKNYKKKKKYINM